MNIIDLIKQRFGRLTVIKSAEKGKCGKLRWLCSCDCKKKIIVFGCSLKSGHTKSCGCLKKEIMTIHGNCKGKNPTKIYGIWKAMIQRCINPNNKYWKDYGGRRINICQRWLEFKNFNEDMGKEWKFGLQIDRKNNNKGYYKENCRWVTSEQQQRNKRNNHLETFNGKTQCIIEWGEKTGISAKTIDTRLRRGWSIKRTLTTPVREKKCE